MLGAKGPLGDVLSSLDAQDAKTAQATNKAKKASQKRQETLEDAFKRIRTLKLNDAELRIVDDVERLIRAGELEQPSGRLSKKAIFELWASYREIVRERKRQHVIDTRPANYWIVQDVITLERVRRLIASNDAIAVDTETSGLDIFIDRMCGWSAYFPNEDIAVYVPFRHTGGRIYDGALDHSIFHAWYDANRADGQVPIDSALSVLREIVCDESKRTLFHNGKYDLHIIANDGIIVNNFWWDTMSVAKLLNEHEPSHSLKALYVKYITGGQDEKITFDDLFDDKTIYDKDILLSGVYAAKDALMTYKLFEFQKPFIDTRDNLKTIWHKIEQRLLMVDWRLERTGFRLDVEHFERLQVDLCQKVEDAEKALITSFNVDSSFIAKMSEALGRTETDFNVNSNQHLAYLIYDHLGVDPRFSTKFKKGERSTAKDVIDALCEGMPALDPLRTYRTAVKMLQFAEKLPSAIEPSTGRIHCRFNNMTGDDFGSSGADTGRYSSSEYCAAKHSRTGDVKKGFNSQQLPSKGGIREGFLPDDGWVFVGADESQIEPRVIAHILYTQYGDDSMKRLYDGGADLYTTMAMQTFGLEREYCVDKSYDPTGTFQPRKVMKTGLLAALYGQSPKSFARVVNVSEDVAKAFFDGLNKSFPGLKRFREDTISRLMKLGNIAFSETEYGHKRRYPTYRSIKAELTKLEKACYKSGCDILREKRPKARVRDGVEDDTLGRIHDKIVAGTPLSDEEREDVTRYGLYCRHQKSKEDFWTWRKTVSAVEREAVNHRIQGTAAGIIKLVMIEIDAWCIRNGFKFHLTAHDEIKVSVPLNRLTSDLVDEVDRIMTQTVTLTVPLKSDCVIERRWMQEVAPDDWDFEKQQPKEDAA